MCSHALPPSVLRYTPPSCPPASTIAYTTPVSTGDVSRPIRPTSPFGSPPLSLIHVAPPSRVRKIALPVPPPLKPHAARCRWYIAAYTVSGSRGSIARSVAPVFASTKSTFFHVWPPSTVLKTPRSSFGPHRWPAAATYTIDGLAGCTRMRPTCFVSRRPAAVQVRPASADLYTPSPHDEL